MTLTSEVQPSEGLAVLRQARAPVAIVHRSGQRWTVVDEVVLDALASKNRTLADLQELLPPLVSIEEEELSDDRAVALARLLQRTGARGAVRWDSQNLHAYSREAVRQALHAISGSERTALGNDASQLPGLAAVPAQIYMCRACQPHRYEIPRLGNEVPACPAHGQMEPYYL